MTEVVKTYETEDIRIPFGVVEDLLDLLKVEDIGSLTDTALASMALNLVSKGLPKIKEMLSIIFGASSEELKHTDTFELVSIVMSIIQYSFSLLGMIVGGSGKN